VPLRISLAGGGSDFSKFYEYKAGSVLSFSINKYVYILAEKAFEEKIRLAYSKIEEVSDYDELKHPLVRNTIKLLGLKEKLEIHSIADVPGNGTGLGSSSAFTVGLISTLQNLTGASISKEEIASLACTVEIDMSNSNIGKQDQYATTFGGLNQFDFLPGGGVTVRPIEIDEKTINYIESHFQLFYIGHGRNASDVLSRSGQVLPYSQYLELTQELVELVPIARAGLLNLDLSSIANILNRSWQIKKTLNPSSTNDIIDKMFHEAFGLGALGGKVLGAGGGGFLFLATPSSEYKEIRRFLGKKYKPLDFKLDFTGVSTIFRDWV
jgi:D-glycero-alpha-D-manno-heptose-7-phosphate kinase